jgi:hypothetical protein
LAEVFEAPIIRLEVSMGRRKGTLARQAVESVIRFFTDGDGRLQDVVKVSALELFPAMSLVRIWFTRCETGERRAFDRAGAACYKALKRLDILFLTNCPLN